MPEEITGGCYCGAIRYRALRPPRISNICHCESCRRTCGAQSVAWVIFPAGDFAFANGEPTRYPSSPGVVRTFCATCGTSLTYETEERPADIDVTTATLDDPEAFPPTRFSTEQKLSWA